MSQAPRLEGIKVLVTRPKERSAELCFLLEDEGALVQALPLLELQPPEDPRPLRAAAEHLQRYTWVAFASPSGVQGLWEEVRQAGSAEHLFRAKIACVGPKTAQAAREYGLNVIAVAEPATGAALAEVMALQLTADDQVLIPAAQDGRRELEDALRAAGHRVTRVAAYRSVRTPLPPGLDQDWDAAPPRVVLFGSPRTAEAFFEALGEGAGRVLALARAVAIGPTTEHALADLGVEQVIVAEQPTSEGLVEATVKAVERT